MKLRGFDQPLYILPFDQRGSFQTGMFGWATGELNAAQTAEIIAAKQLIYEAFQATTAAGIGSGKVGILVDEQFGAAILHDALLHGYMTACPVEKSGQQEFEFEYGEDFEHHIEDINPTFCKVLVRYNPEGDPWLNERQGAKLRTLIDYLTESNRKFMFELRCHLKNNNSRGSEATRRRMTWSFVRNWRCRLSSNSRMRMSNLTSGKSKDSTGWRTLRRWWRWRDETAVSTSAASFWGAEKTNRGSKRGYGRRRKFQDSSDSPSDALRFGSH
jgi:hypothetical protein